MGIFQNIAILVLGIIAAWCYVSYIIEKGEHKNTKIVNECHDIDCRRKCIDLKFKIEKRDQIIAEKDQTILAKNLEIIELKNPPIVPDWDGVQRKLSKENESKEADRNMRGHAMELAIRSMAPAAYPDQGLTDRANQIYQFLKNEK